MQIDRASAIKLGSFAGVTAVAGACHYFGLGEHAGLLGTVLALAGSGAHALVGHLGVDVVKGITERAGKESARGVENRDLHRLIGETIAHILEREEDGAPGGKSGAQYLKQAAAAFRCADWMRVELTGSETAVSEPAALQYFAGDAEAIGKAPVLVHGEWLALVQKVMGAPTQIREYSEALDYAATKLRDHFAFELWEAAKYAWKKSDLAWPALILRLLSLILRHAGEAAINSAATAEQVTKLREEITALRDATGKAAAGAEKNAPDLHKEILTSAIRDYQDDLNINLSLIEQHISGLHIRHDRHDEDLQRVLDELASVKAALDNPRVVPVKEPLINLPNTSKQILARDREARELLDALSSDGPGIVSIAAPPGFGKSAVFALAVRMELSNGNPRGAGLNGIAVLDAKATAPGIVSFAGLLGRITGLQGTAAQFQSATAGHPGTRLSELFFDFLRQAGKVWLVVENAEAVLAPTAPADVATDFRDLLKAWCQTRHQAKLLLLTRHAMHPVPECHRGLSDVERALLGGLPEDAAVQLLRQSLADTRFRTAAEALLRQIVRKLHHVPMALEQFAGYLHLNEQGVDLDQRFLDQNDLLRLRASERMEDLLLRMIGESLKGLDATSLDLVQVVAWASVPVPRGGLMELQQDGAALLTRLIRSNLMLVQEGTAAEGRSFDMHPLIREASTESSRGALDFARITRAFRNAGTAEWKQNQFLPALTLYALAESAARIVGKRDDLAGSIMGRGLALRCLGRLEEAVAADDEAIAIYRGLVEKEHRQDLRNTLAMGIINRGTTQWDLGRFEEALAAYDESIAIHRELVEKEHRQELRNALAKAIMGRGIALWKLGRLEETVPAYDESIAIYRELVEKEHRQESRPDLAIVIMNKGNALSGLGQSEEAVAAYDESIAIHRELVEEEHRQELRSDLARAIMNRGNALHNLGRLAAFVECIAIYREMVEKEDRQELRNDLAKAIMGRGIAAAGLGRMDEALAAYDESIAIHRALVEKEDRQELRDDLASAIMNRGAALVGLSRMEEAVAAFEGSIAIYRELVEKEHRQELRGDLARACCNLALAREQQKVMPAALKAAGEARTLLDDLVKEGMKHLERDLARAISLETRLAQGSR
jgi:tetratricopeptide (TPR) repeat protein